MYRAYKRLLSFDTVSKSEIRTITAENLSDYMEYAKGRMRKKLLGAQEALAGNVSEVCIGSHSLQAVLNGAGTTIHRSVRPRTSLEMIRSHS